MNFKINKILGDLNLPSIFTLSNNKIRSQVEYLANNDIYKINYGFKHRRQLIAFFTKKTSRKKCHVKRDTCL